ncbi:MAG: MBL fold metallo-hydrolase [Thermoflexibacter sp.]|jgi:L-ascorbate metabolism protein UlaG (beta-lactamase superfamily)|nr:MBL fold metallo-hydrolase [Thermoflexibacter sp.]
MEYVLNPLLPTINPNFKGNPLVKGRFVHPDYPFRPDFRKLFKWQLSTNPQKKEKKLDTWKLQVIHNKDFLNKKEDMIVWLGHATFFIRIGGIHLLTDPIFYGMPLVPRLIGLPIAPHKIVGLDYILLSHGHFDHLDKKSMVLLYQKNKAELLTSLQLGKIVKRWIPNLQCQEAGWYQQYVLKNKDIEIFYLPARHWFRRSMNDTNRTLWGSFVIRHQEKTIFFGADSGYGTHFAEISSLFPKIDICIMGVGAYKPSYMMQESHTSPHEAVQAFNEMVEIAHGNKTKTLIPMHYGTYDLADEPLGEPQRILLKLKHEGKIKGNLKILSLGEEMII